MSLSVALAEPCVILKGTRTSESDQGFVRGNLTLKLAKATHISTIEVVLEGKTKAEWTHGTPSLIYMSSAMGTCQSHIVEDRTILTQKSTVYPNPLASPAQASVFFDSPSIEGHPPDYPNGSGADPLADGAPTSAPTSAPSSPGPPKKPRLSWFRRSESGTNLYQSGDANFAPGTYNFPFSIPIPHDSPTTTKGESGYISYYLKAYAHRPGAFTHNLTAGMEVVVVACPVPDEHHLLIERQWKNALRYRLTMMRKAFVAGSEVPLDLTLVPLAPINLYLIQVTFEERVSYSVKSSSQVNYDPQRVFQAINLKGSVTDHQPLLPLANAAAATFTASPLDKCLASNEQEDEIREHLSRPHGPWHLTLNMRVPPKLQASHDYPESSIKVAHQIKVTLRVGMADTDKKSGVFDITMQFPCQIISELCEDEWSSLALPTYHRSVNAGETCMMTGMTVGNDVSLEELFRLRTDRAQAYAPSLAPTYVEFLPDSLNEANDL